MRFDDFGAVMTSGPRIGQRVLQTVWDRIRPGGANAVNAVDFQQTRNDISYCAPSRCSIMTGLYRHNHGVNNTTVGTYYTNCRRGTRNAQLYSGTNQWEGPWEFDLAAKAGLASTPVAAASQPYVGQTSSVRNGYSTTTGTYTGTIGRGDGAVGVAGDDDLQARTGQIWNWLNSVGVPKLMMFGKYQNGFGSTVSGLGGTFASDDSNGAISIAKVNRFVPPGVTDFYAVADDLQDHYHTPMCEYTGSAAANPGNGDGAIGTATLYQYDWQISTITHNGLTGASGRAIVTTAAPFSYTSGGSTVADPLVVGEEVSIDYVTGVTAYNGTYTVTKVTSSTVFEVQLAGPLAAGTVTSSQTNGTNTAVYRRKYWAERLHRDQMLNALAGVGDTQPFLLYYGSRMPHGSLSHDGLNADFIELDRRYYNSATSADSFPVAAGDALHWNGHAGEISPATLSAELTTARKKMWQQRMTMLASLDDTVRDLLDYCDGRWGTAGYIVVFVSDNGYQYGEQTNNGEDVTTAWSPIGGKIFVYDGSVRVPLFLRHPDYPAQTVTELVWTGDLCRTLLDIFARNYPALVTHHAQSKRDGRSLIKLLDNNNGDPDRDRAVFGMGLYKSATTGTNGTTPDGQFVVTRSLKKLIRSHATPAVRQRHDMTAGNDYVTGTASPFGASTDWETTNLDTLTNGTGTPDPISSTLTGYIDALQTCRYNPSTDTNNCRDARL